MKKKPKATLLTAQKTGGFAALALAVFCADMLPAQAQQNAAVRSLSGGDRNLLVQAVAQTTTNSSQRIALVIGNAAYKEAPLVNPVNDARSIAQALKESGFTVILRENTDQRALLQALREFGDLLRGGGTGLFYYAGHGMQIKGRNYLIPVGAAIEREDEVAYNAVDAQAVLDKMEAAGNAANIMILDACRNNPFTRSTRSGQAGLAQMDAPVGTLVAFSTSPGAVASDGSGANGLYTQHLLTAVRQNGSKIEDVFKQVRSNVRRDSQGKQVPWEVTSLEGDFYFRGAPAASDGGAGAGAAVESALWDAVKTSDVPIEVRAYLNRYPDGQYAGAARERLARLQPALAVAAPLALAKPSGQANAAVVASGTSAVTQTAVNKRTDELLATIAAQKPAPAGATARPTVYTNSFGMTTGDLWRYQTVDKFKKEVVDNWSRRIDSFNPDSSIKLSGGYATWAADGALKLIQATSGFRREYSPGYKWLPTTLKAGYTEPLKHTLRYNNVGASNGTEDREGTLTVVGKETVKVPAGEFEAWKIEAAGFGNGKNSSGNYTVRFKETFWYVPALRNFVASDFEQFSQSGQVQFNSRQELTSFNVRGAENLAQR